MYVYVSTSKCQVINLTRWQVEIVDLIQLQVVMESLNLKSTPKLHKLPQ